MQPAVSILLLCLPPILLTGMIGGGLYWIRGFRRSFGAHRSLPGAAVVAAIGLVILHAGYFTAPFLLGSDRAATALWLVAPVALIATAACLWFVFLSTVSFSPDAGDQFRRRSLIAAGLLATYLTPVVVLVLNLK